VNAAVLAPKDYVGVIMELCQSRRGVLQGMEYLGEDRVEIRYTIPLG
jgi:GTP-binding protein LepA